MLEDSRACVTRPSFPFQSHKVLLVGDERQALPVRPSCTQGRAPGTKSAPAWVHRSGSVGVDEPRPGRGDPSQKLGVDQPQISQANMSPRLPLSTPFDHQDVNNENNPSPLGLLLQLMCAYHTRGIRVSIHNPETPPPSSLARSGHPCQSKRPGRMRLATRMPGEAVAARRVTLRKIARARPGGPEWRYPRR